MPNLVPRETAHSLVFSVKEAIEYSSLGRTTFYKYVKLGKIPAHKAGRRTFILQDELYQALKSLPLAGVAS
jgi:excisionase family DNA binding protein